MLILYCIQNNTIKKKGKCFPYSIPSIGVQAVSPQVTVSHPSSGRLPLLSAATIHNNVTVIIKFSLGVVVTPNS